jgi:hypothetical protein
LRSKCHDRRGRIVLSAPLGEIRAAHGAAGRVPSLDEIFIAQVRTKPR